MINTEQIVNQINTTNSIFELDETSQMIKNVANLTAIYYNSLIEAGIPEASAALITAHYSANISSLGN